MDFSANNLHWFSARFLICGTLFFLATSCNSTNKGAQPANEKLLQAYEVLHQRLQALLEQDNTYAGLLSKPVATEVLDESSGQIIQAEIALQRTIDSLDRTASKTDTGGQNKSLYEVTAHFKALLQNRRLMSDMRMALSAGSDDSTTAQQMLMRLRADLRERDERIAALEKARQAANSQTPPGTKISGNTRRDAMTGGENIEQLKQRTKDLQQSLQDMETKYFTVGRNYLLLKKEHERTMNELAALRRSNGQ